MCKKYLLLITVSLGIVLLMRSLGMEKAPVFSHVVREMGYNDVEETPFEVTEFTIPKTFDAVYEKYNTIQKEGGYDLSLFKGKKCTRYTYLIPSVNARANVIVCDGKIIGGDICSITIDGIMLPIRRTERHT